MAIGMWIVVIMILSIGVAYAICFISFSKESGYNSYIFIGIMCPIIAILISIGYVYYTNNPISV